MKKLSLFTLLITLIFISCSKDDDASNQEIPANKNLIGTWELTYRKENNNTTPNTLDNCEKTSTIEFKSDNTYSEKTFVEISSNCVSDGEFSGSWLESNNQLTLNFIENGENTTNISKFSIADDELTLVFDEITEKYKKK
ncbi:hypothetical protein ATO12_04595 [Aquimarina atlantica]|uniref:Lipocalin-like domain-containing protein n=1 Tax=Aquimarina atlantica TaxID=1317122 RepID=A0A023BP87_9FLAO|nr:lipocalin family protein [Aquimarina atlantica]EZH71900.1 hypothetical protein ATO12_04595 [Aquimarina atlantica]